MCRHVTLIFYIDDTTNQPKVYPINLLRNLALEVVQTSHVLVHDVDFVPSLNLDRDIRQALDLRQVAHVATQSSRSQQQHQALVVPALQMNVVPHEKSESITKLIPSTFDEATLCVKTGICQAFDENYNKAHGATRTDQWLQREWYHDIQCQDNQPMVQDLHYVTCIDAPSYEPYLVLPWCLSHGKQRIVPYYDERFVGYGWNKIQMIHHLRYLGFLLWILPRGFLVHVPHEPSASQHAFTANHHQTARQAYNAFENDLQQTLQWQTTNLRTCQHWNKYYVNLTYSQAFCKAYV